MPEPNELNHLQRYLVEEAVEDYQHGQLTRRQTLKMIAGVLGSLVAANSFLAACAPVQPATPTTSAGAAPAAAATTPPATAAATTASTAAATSAAAAATGTPAAPAAGATTEATTAATSAAAPTAAQAAQATRVATQAVLATTATAVAPAGSTPAVPAGVRVSADDPAIQASDVRFPVQGATLFGYLARPTGNNSVPPVLVCHENRGLTDHIKDVARRLGKAGYAALALDLLSREGGTANIADQTQIPGMLSKITPAQFVQDFQSALKYLQNQSNVIKDRPGMVGFCFGGGITWLCATQIPELRAAVPFYGPNPPLTDVPKIQAAVLAIYGGLDQRIDAGIPAIEQAMQQNNKVFEKIIYPNANHAFHNDTGANYNPEAAVDAWAKTLAWFGKYLKA